MKYINKDGDIFTKQDLKKLHKNTSIKKDWDQDVLDFLGVEEIVETPRPENTNPLIDFEPGEPVQVDGVWESTWTQKYTFDSVSRAQECLIGLIKNKRQQAIGGGVEYTFSDGAGTIQTDSESIRNLQACASAAQMLPEDAYMVFRDKENFNHVVTPAEMKTLSLAVFENASRIYADSWELIALIGELNTMDELVEIVKDMK